MDEPEFKEKKKIIKDENRESKPSELQDPCKIIYFHSIKIFLKNRG